MSNATFHLIYDGPALQKNEIDVRDLAPALLAMGQVLEQANLSVNNGKSKVALRVKGSFKTGSFGIEFAVIQSMLDQTLNLFKQTPLASAKELVELLGFGYLSGKSLVDLLKWLRNRPIKEVVLLEDDLVRVIVDKESYETERKVIDLFRNYQLRRAFQSAVVDPLEKDGIESVAFSGSPEKGFVTIHRNDSGWFRCPPAEEENLTDTTEQATLQLISVAFRDDNKWRFSDGSSSFFASITDTAFLNRVLSGGESFSAGDLLVVKLRKRQWLVGEMMKSEHEVLEVIEHRAGRAQLKIPFRKATEDDISAEE